MAIMRERQAYQIQKASIRIMEILGFINGLGIYEHEIEPGMRSELDALCEAVRKNSHPGNTLVYRVRMTKGERWEAWSSLR